MLIRVVLVGAHALSSTKFISLRVSVLLGLVFIVNYWLCGKKMLEGDWRRSLLRAAEGWLLFSLTSIIFATLVNIAKFS